ncbi:hypothetical protein ACVWYQ_006562 [Bradyrhizobium sp. USDA 3397]
MTTAAVTPNRAAISAAHAMLVMQLGEGLVFVGGVHRLMLVLGKADLLGDPAIQHMAGNAVILFDGLLLDERLERREAAAAGHDLEQHGLALAFQHLAHGQVLNKAVGFDAGGKFFHACVAVRAPDIEIGGDEFRERDLLDG